MALSSSPQAGGVAARGAEGSVVDPARCLLPEAYAELATLPPSRLVLPIGLGAHVLRNTPHAVLSTGFHRNVQSMLEEMAFFSGDEAAARRTVAERGMDYVVTCPKAKLFRGWATVPDWAWLSEVSSPGALLRIQRIER